MRTVHKFTVPRIGSTFLLESGRTFKPLTMQMQHGKPQIWAEVETTEQPPVQYQLIVVGTGHLVPSGLEWIATCQDGAFVWHLYGPRK